MRTMRWRLTLTYAGIALLTAVILGAVLLGALGVRFAKAEQQYLTANAAAVAAALARSEGLPDGSERMLSEMYSFLTQTRVRVLDGRGGVIADSDSPVTTAPGLLTSEVITGTVGIPEGIELPEGMAATASAMGSGIVAMPGGMPVPDAGFTSPGAVVGPWAGLMDFGLGHDTDGMMYSDAAAGVAFTTADGAERTVELSEGPVFGRDIMRVTATGWLLASVVAVLLAAMAGAAVSRRVSAPVVALTDVARSMASGDLSARASVVSQDEIGTLATAYNDMADRVEATVESLRRFIGDAAHQLNTPLTALHANVELAARPDAPAEAAERALDQLRRLEGLTRDMLDLSRVESRPAGRESLDLACLVREVADTFASRAEQRDIALEVTVPETAPVEADRAQLVDALSNLLDNALKFSSEGSPVAMTLVESPDSWAVTVADSGIGIPSDDMPRLFSRFHRGRNAAALPGSGLGLAIVKAVADAHGGSVAAESDESGTRITLRVPRVSRG